MENAKNVVWEIAGWLVSDQQLSLREDCTLCSAAADLTSARLLDPPDWLALTTFGRGIVA